MKPAVEAVAALQARSSDPSFNAYDRIRRFKVKGGFRAFWFRVAGFWGLGFRV